MKNATERNGIETPLNKDAEEKLAKGLREAIAFWVPRMLNDRMVGE